MKDFESQAEEKSQVYKEYGEAFFCTQENEENQLKFQMSQIGEQDKIDLVEITKGLSQKKLKVKEFLTVNYFEDHTMQSLNSSFSDLQVLDFISKLNMIYQNQQNRYR